MDISEINNLRQYVKDSEVVFNSAKNRLAAIEIGCRHTWSEPVKTHVEVTEYRNGAMNKQGIDFWYEQIPYKTSQPAWERTCSNCGKKEMTTETLEKTVKIPKF